jgi:hypothetical protein
VAGLQARVLAEMRVLPLPPGHGQIPEQRGVVLEGAVLVMALMVLLWA